MTQHNANMYMVLTGSIWILLGADVTINTDLIKADKKINKPQAVCVIDKTIVCL